MLLGTTSSLLAHSCQPKFNIRLPRPRDLGPLRFRVCGCSFGPRTYYGFTAFCMTTSMLNYHGFRGLRSRI